MGQGAVEKKPNIPTFQNVVAENKPTLLAIYQALDHGIGKCREFYEEHELRDESGNLAFDPYLSPHLVRFFAKRYLEEHGYAVMDEINDIAQSGLYVIKGRFRFRVWKSTDGRLPVPGYSKEKQEFYSNPQIPLQFPSQENEESTSSAIKLAILWNANSQYTNVSMFSLSLPMKGDSSRASVDDWWTEEIENPIFTLGDIEVETTPDKNEDDLDIGYEKKDTGTEGAE